ncbi:hypothetical protein ACFYV7_38930 [Nocardia suismassiliense]|uniref:Uncharacterized protein n=1 Tax=Nocardia suismassiliense TaxID=2077092 RepID=A0ABW6R5M5_9NOCA
MASEIGQVLVSSEIRRNDRLVVVTAGVPQRFSHPTDNGYLCRVRIDGLGSGPITIESIDTAAEGALVGGLTKASNELSITLTALLAEACIGVRTGQTFRHSAFRGTRPDTIADPPITRFR